MKNNLIFLAIGEMYNKQCMYAILSLLNVYGRLLPNSLHVYVHTDVPDFYSSLADQVPVDIICIDKVTIDQWKNQTNFFLRAKICVIKDFLKAYPGNMIFVDTDVIFKRRIDSTFESVSKENHILLHRESRLSSPDYKYFLTIYGDKTFLLSSGRTITIDKRSEMWNSGLIGVSSNQRDVVEDVLDLCDQLLSFSSSRLLEQLAFSLVMQDAGKLKCDRSKLVHYWWKKSFFNAVINKVLQDGEGNLEKLLHQAATLDPTNRTFLLRMFYNLHPRSMLRQIIVKISLMSNIPIK